MTSAPSAAQLGPYARNKAVTHKNICPGKRAERRIDRNDSATLDEIVAARDLAFLGTHQSTPDLLRLSLIAQKLPRVA